MRRCGKVLGAKMVPMFASKTAMDSCSLTVLEQDPNFINQCDCDDKLVVVFLGVQAVQGQRWFMVM